MMGFLRSAGYDLRREDGATLIAVVLVLFVMIVIGTTTLRVATHANDATTVDRERVQAVQAAEAGIHTGISRLQRNAACDSSATSPVELVDGDEVVGSYQVRIDPEDGTSCDTERRVIHAWGFGATGGERSMRHLEVQVDLIPQDGFQFTLFASGPDGLVVANNNARIDGDVYAENMSQTHNNLDAQKVISPGSIHTKDNAVYSSTLWAGGDVTVGQNAKIGASVLATGSSANGDVTLENGAEIAKDIKAAGTVNLPTNYSVGGSITENHPNLPPPPQLDKPDFTWDPNNYSSPQTFSTASELSDALEANKDDLHGTYYTDDPGATVKMPKHATVTGPLTVVTTGKVDAGRSMKASGGPWQVVVVAEDGGTGAIGVEKPASFDSALDVLLYTEGEVDLKNQTTMRGAIYADEIKLKNKVTVNRSESLAKDPPVGFDFTQSSARKFLVAPVIWREIVPGDPPS